MKMDRKEAKKMLEKKYLKSKPSRAEMLKIVIDDFLEKNIDSIRNENPQVEWLE